VAAEGGSGQPSSGLSDFRALHVYKVLPSEKASQSVDQPRHVEVHQQRLLRARQFQVRQDLRVVNRQEPLNALQLDQ